MSRRSNRKAQIKAQKVQEERRNAPAYPVTFLKNHFKVFAVIIVVVIVIAVFAFNLVHLPFLKSNAYQLPSNIPFSDFGTDYTVNSSDYAPSNTVNIYFVTWQGCPYGAANSWGLYNYLNGFSSISSSVTGHSSDPNEGRLASIPGLLFNDNLISVTGVNGITINLYTYYLYNEYMTQSINSPVVNINNSNAITVALSELRADNLPAPIYNIVKDFTTVVPATGYSKASAYLGNPAHINTITVFTGPKGTVLINGGWIDPIPLQSFSYQTLESNPSLGTGVSTGTTQVADIVNSLS